MMHVFITDHLYARDCSLKGNLTEVEVESKILRFIRVQETWILKLPYEFRYLHKDEIQNQKILIIEDQRMQRTYELFFYENLDDSFVKYNRKDTIHIGPNVDCDICYPIDVWIDTKNHSFQTNSNNLAINETCKKEGFYQDTDHFLLAGFEMIMSHQFCMIRYSSEKIHLQRYQRVSYHIVLNPTCFSILHPKQEHQYPSNVVLNEVEHINILNSDSILISVLPSIVMLSASLFTGTLNAYRSYMNGREIIEVLPSIILPGVMLSSLVFLQPLLRFLQSRKKKKAIHKRDLSYKNYLETVQASILNDFELWKKEQYYNYPSSEKVIELLSKHMYLSKRPYLRIGLTEQIEPITYKMNGSLRNEETEIRTLLDSFEKELQLKQKIPYLIDQSKKIRIDGNDAQDLFLSLFLQAGFYWSDIALYTNKEFIDLHPYIRYLPNLIHHGKRHIYTSMNDIPNPQDYLIFATEDCASLNPLIWISNTTSKEDVWIHCSEDAYVYDCHSYTKKEIQFEKMPPKSPSISVPTNPICIPSHSSFLDLYDCDDAKGLNLIERWNHNCHNENRIAYLGYDDTHTKISIDLFEKENGPHGLIAGMTGSGKSEFIITMLLSLMVNYSPEDLQIAFIDFKGGGASSVFQVLGKPIPHVVGCITNLQKENMNRMLYALRNECHKRERKFNEIGKKYHTCIMNLEDYRNIRNEYDLPKIADLCIVVDEFAELKSQQPEFLTELISVARVGRSLGMHLILSTQKPAGVINEQIWANSRFKICLKVSDKQDSQEVLHQPIAVELSQPGEFILSCDQKIQKGKCAYSGYRKSVQNMQCYIIDEKGDVTNDYQSLGLHQRPQILDVCEEIVKAWKKKPIDALWQEPIKPVSYKPLLKLKSLGVIDDIYQQQYQYLNIDDHDWLFLSSDQEVNRSVAHYVYCLSKEIHPTTKILWLKDHDFHPKELEKWIKESKQDKILVIQDYAQFRNKITFDMKNIIENRKEYHLQLFIFLRTVNNMPYHEQTYFSNRISLKNDSTDEMSSFLGARVYEPIQQSGIGYYIYNKNKCNIAIGYIENEDMK